MPTTWPPARTGTSHRSFARWVSTTSTCSRSQSIRLVTPMPFLKTDFTVRLTDRFSPDGQVDCVRLLNEKFDAGDSNQVVVRSYPGAANPVPIQGPSAESTLEPRRPPAVLSSRGHAIWSVSFVSRGSRPTVGTPQLVLNHAAGRRCRRRRNSTWHRMEKVPGRQASARRRAPSGYLSTCPTGWRPRVLRTPSRNDPWRDVDS